MALKEYLLSNCSVPMTEFNERAELKVVKNRGRLNFRCPYLVKGTVECTVPGNSICRIKEAFINSRAVLEVEADIRTQMELRRRG